MDRTILIPTPGGATRGFSSSLKRSEIFNHNDDFHCSSVNPLVASSNTLLILLNQIRTTVQHLDIPGLHRKLVEEIQAFEKDATLKGLNNEHIKLVRYLLCTALDEAVLNTPWGSVSGWSQRSLLGIFHQETSGGEKVFIILSKLLENPIVYMDVLEFYYLCISFGFQGRYRMIPRGQDQIEHIQDGLLRTIKQYKMNSKKSLSKVNHAKNNGNKLRDYIPVWVILSVTLAASFVSFLGFRYWAYVDSSKIINHIQQDRKEVNLINLDDLYLDTDLN